MVLMQVCQEYLTSRAPYCASVLAPPAAALCAASAAASAASISGSSLVARIMGSTRAESGSTTCKVQMNFVKITSSALKCNRCFHLRQQLGGQEDRQHPRRVGVRHLGGMAEGFPEGIELTAGKGTRSCHIPVARSPRSVHLACAHRSPCERSWQV